MLAGRFGMAVFLCELIAGGFVAALPMHTAADSNVAGGINAEPSIRPTVFSGPNPDGWWCVPPACYQSADPSSTINQELSIAARLHVSNVRLEFPWALMQPRQGGFDWTRSDLIVGAARAHHVTLQPVLMWTPSWENTKPSEVTAGGDFAAFVQAFVERYAHAFPVIEMWNEPDGGAYGGYTHGREQLYVETILNPGYDAVKAVDPSIRVELGGSINDSGGCCPFLSAVIADGGKFDIAAFHNYVGATSALGEAQSYRNVLDNTGRRGTPIWMGEYGVQNASSSDQNQQALMQAVLGGNGSDLAMAQWYNLRDDDAMSCCPAVVVVAAHWGLVQHDGCTVKAGYASMATLLGGDPSPPPCAGTAGASTRGSPSATQPVKPAPVVGGQHGGSVDILPWALAAAAGTVALTLLFLRYRDRLRRRPQHGEPSDDDYW